MPFSPVGLTKSVGLILPSKLKPSPMRLVRIVGRPGIHIGLYFFLVTAVRQRPVPDIEAGQVGGSHLIQSRWCGDPVDFLLRAPFLARHRDPGAVVTREMRTAAMRA